MRDMENRDMENRDMDNVLRQSLAPTYKPDESLNQWILRQAQLSAGDSAQGILLEGAGRKGWGRKCKIAYVLKAAVFLLMLTGVSGTVYAAWRLYTAEETALRVNDSKLAKAFREETGQQAGQGETQSYGGYQVTLLGVVSGQDISEYPMGACTENIQADRTYAAVAIRRENGGSFTDTDSFFVSPLIQGYDPVSYNAATLRGAATYFEEEGVLYWLINCSNVEYFADHRIYLCVTDTDFYKTGLYNYDETDGSISRREEYDGLNALFELELDAEKADPAAAHALLAENRAATENEAAAELNVQEKTAERSGGAVSDFLAELTLHNLEEKCVLLEDTVQTLMPDEEGMVNFTYCLPGNDPSYQNDSTGGQVSWLFRHPWGDDRHTWSAGSGEGLSDLTIHIYTLNDDGSVTFGVYVPKDASRYLE